MFCPSSPFVKAIKFRSSLHFRFQEKVNFPPEQALKTQKRYLRTELLFLYLRRYVPASLLPGMDLNPLYRRLGGHQSYTGRVRKISLSTGIRSQKHLLRSELVYRLNYAGSFRNGCSIKNVSPESVCLHNF